MFYDFERFTFPKNEIIRMITSDHWSVKVPFDFGVRFVNEYLSDKYNLIVDFKIYPNELDSAKSWEYDKDCVSIAIATNKYVYERFGRKSTKKVGKIVITDKETSECIELIPNAHSEILLVYTGYMFRDHLLDWLKVGVIPKIYKRSELEYVPCIVEFEMDDIGVRNIVFNDDIFIDEAMYRILELEICTIPELCDYNLQSSIEFSKMMSNLRAHPHDRANRDQKNKIGRTCSCPPKLADMIMSQIKKF